MSESIRAILSLIPEHEVTAGAGDEATTLASLLATVATIQRGENDSLRLSLIHVLLPRCGNISSCRQYVIEHRTISKRVFQDEQTK